MTSFANVHGFAFCKRNNTLLIDFRQNGKQRCKKLTIKKIKDGESVAAIVESLKRKYPQLLLSSQTAAEDEALCDSLTFAVEDMVGHFRKIDSLIKNLDEVDLNRVSEEENLIAKQKMDEVFEARRLKPGDPGFVWDKRIEFSPPEESCDWDD